MRSPLPLTSALLLSLSLSPTLDAQDPVNASGRRGNADLAQIVEQLRAQLEAIEASARDLRSQLDTMGNAGGRRGAGGARGGGRRGGRGNFNDPSRRAAMHERNMERKAQRDAEFMELSDGYIDMTKTIYQSRIGGMDIPVYVFEPLEKRGPKGHPALIWVHGGVHGDMTPNYWPYIKEATDRGYIVVAPEYRGSTGYGQEHYEAIDYGGWEVEDVLSAVDFIRDNLPHVDMDRLGQIGWSHGGFITLHSNFRETDTFKAAVAMVPVTNLVFRLAYKGPGYQRNYTAQERIGGLMHERSSDTGTNPQAVYIERSPVYHVEKLQTPMLVHVTRNDRDVNFVEAEAMIHALEYHKPELVETKVYDDPEGGHSFQRLVDPDDPRKARLTPEARDSWNRVWAHFEWYLRPYEDPSADTNGR